MHLKHTFIVILDTKSITFKLSMNIHYQFTCKLLSFKAYNLRTKHNLKVRAKRKESRS